VHIDPEGKDSPLLSNIASHMGQKNLTSKDLAGTNEGSSVLKLSLSSDNDQFQNKDVDDYILKSFGLDAYLPDYLHQPEIKSTSVASFNGGLDLNKIANNSQHSGLALTKVDDIEGLFISPGAVLKLGLNIPKATKADAPTLGKRLMANYSGISPNGELIGYASVGSQSMFNALTESKDSMPLLMTTFDCSYPYKLGDTCNANFALSVSNTNQKSQGKLYIQDAAGEAVALPTYIGYTTVVEPHIVEGEAGSSDSGTIHIADVSANKINKIELTLPMDFMKIGVASMTCTDKSLQDKISTVYVRDLAAAKPSQVKSGKVNVDKDIKFQHGVAQQSNVSTVSAPECDLKIMLRNMKEGTYPIQVKSYRKDGTIDIESSEVQATAPF
jgi:hypothetical protein